MLCFEYTDTWPGKIVDYLRLEKLYQNKNLTASAKAPEKFCDINWQCNMTLHDHSHSKFQTCTLVLHTIKKKTVVLFVCLLLFFFFFTTKPCWSQAEFLFEKKDHTGYNFFRKGCENRDRGGGVKRKIMPFLRVGLETEWRELTLFVFGVNPYKTTLKFWIIQQTSGAYCKCFTDVFFLKVCKKYLKRLLDYMFWYFYL